MANSKVDDPSIVFVAEIDPEGEAVTESAISEVVDVTDKTGAVETGGKGNSESVAVIEGVAVSEGVAVTGRVATSEGAAVAEELAVAE